jgi:hypothetical protein
MYQEMVWWIINMSNLQIGYKKGINTLWGWSWWRWYMKYFQLNNSKPQW